MTELNLNIAETPNNRAVFPTHWYGELRALLALGIPMALTQLAGFSIYTVDTIMIGRLSPEDLGAAALAIVVYFLLWMIGSGPVMAVSPLVSQALGADQTDRQDARRSVRMALWVVMFMTPLIFLVAWAAKPVMLALGQDPVLSTKASAYILVLMPGWPFAMGIMVLRNFLAAIEKTRVPLILTIVTVLVNAGLNYILIFGVWGFPRLELVGAGIASSLATILCYILFVLYIKWDKDARQFNLFEHWWRPYWGRLREVIRLGWPMSVTTLFEGMLFNACVFLMGLIGVMEVAAYQIALNIAALAFMLPFGLSMAGAIRIGLAKGAQNPTAIKRAAWVTNAAAIFGITVFAVPIALFPSGIARLYLDINDPQNAVVVALVASFLPIAAAFMLFDAVQVASNQLLRGLKDVTVPMIMTGVSYWVVGFPVAVWLGLYTEFSARGVWIGLMLSLITASILLGGRLYILVWYRPAKALQASQT